MQGCRMKLALSSSRAAQCIQLLRLNPKQADFYSYFAAP